MAVMNTTPFAKANLFDEMYALFKETNRGDLCEFDFNDKIIEIFCRYEGATINDKPVSFKLPQNGFFTVTANFDMESYSELEVANFLHPENAISYAFMMKERFLNDIPNGALDEKSSFIDEDEIFRFVGTSEIGDNFVSINVERTNFKDLATKSLHCNDNPTTKVEFEIGNEVLVDMSEEYGFTGNEIFKVSNYLIEEDGTHVYTVEKDGQFYEVYPSSMTLFKNKNRWKV